MPVEQIVCQSRLHNCMLSVQCYDACTQVHGREYRTWRGFVEDFELICNNAMIYNQKRSRVHKTALSVLRAGKKWLQAAELAGRKVRAGCRMHLLFASCSLSADLHVT